MNEDTHLLILRVSCYPLPDRLAKKDHRPMPDKHKVIVVMPAYHATHTSILGCYRATEILTPDGGPA